MVHSYVSIVSMFSINMTLLLINVESINIYLYLPSLFLFDLGIFELYYYKIKILSIKYFPNFNQKQQIYSPRAFPRLVTLVIPRRPHKYYPLLLLQIPKCKKKLFKYVHRLCLTSQMSLSVLLRKFLSREK